MKFSKFAATAINDALNELVEKHPERYVNDEEKESVIEKYLDAYIGSAKIVEKINLYFEDKHKWIHKNETKADLIILIETIFKEDI